MFSYAGVLYRPTVVGGAIALVKAGKKTSPGQMSLFDEDEHPRDEHGQFKKKDDLDIHIDDLGDFDDDLDDDPQLGARVGTVFSVLPDFGSPEVKALYATKEVQDLMKWFDAESDAQLKRNDWAFDEEEFDQLFEEFNEKLYQLAGEDFDLFEQLSMKIGVA